MYKYVHGQQACRAVEVCEDHMQGQSSLTGWERAGIEARYWAGTPPH